MRVGHVRRENGPLVFLADRVAGGRTRYGTRGVPKTSRAESRQLFGELAAKQLCNVKHDRRLQLRTGLAVQKPARMADRPSY